MLSALLHLAQFLCKRLAFHIQLFLQHQHNLLSLANFATRNKVSYRLRHMQANHKYIQSRQCTNKESHLPAILRNQQIGNAGSCQPAQAPEAFQENNKPSPQFGRSIFRHQGSCYWQFTTKAKTNQETEQHQGFIVPGQGTGTCSQAVKNNRQGKYQLTANPISNGTGDNST